MLAFLLNLFTGGTISTITNAIISAQHEYLAAQTDKDRIAADERVKTLQAQRDVLVTESASGGFQSWVRPLFALPFVIFNFKVVVWDKVFGLGTTDPLSDELFQIEMIIITAYFLTRGAEKVARIVRG